MFYIQIGIWMVYLVATKLNGAYIDFQEWIIATKRHTGHDSFFEAFVGDEQSILSQEKLKKEKGWKCYVSS